MIKEKYISPTIQVRKVSIPLHLLESTTEANAGGTEGEDTENSFAKERGEGFSDVPFDDNSWN